jgi:hypothetical protein
MKETTYPIAILLMHGIAFTAHGESNVPDLLPGTREEVTRLCDASFGTSSNTPSIPDLNKCKQVEMAMLKSRIEICTKAYDNFYIDPGERKNYYQICPKTPTIASQDFIGMQMPGAKSNPSRKWDKFTGNWKTISEQGRGVFELPEGDVFEVGWRNGKLNGNGIYRYSDNHSFAGNWLNGEIDGDAVFSYKNSARYESAWKADKTISAGRLVLDSGEIVPVDWKGLSLTEIQGKSDWVALTQTASHCKSANIIGEEIYTQQPYSSSFFGLCGNNTASNGIAIFKYNDIPIDIACINNGTRTPDGRTNGFDTCKEFWQLIPNHCSTGNYIGLCERSTPSGVGFMSGGGTSLFGNGTAYIYRGMFKGEKLHGFGFHGSITGCGLAGCSGNSVNETGWFKDGKLAYSCNSFSDCIRNASGKDYVTFLQSNQVSSDAGTLNTLRRLNSFEGWLQAFEQSGNPSDLKTAELMAKDTAQKAKLEHTLMKIAGYDKALALTAQVRSGQESVPLKESDHLLGFVRGVNSNVPVKITWTLSQDSKRFPIRFGQYKIKIKVGLDVSKQITTCVGMCRTREDTDSYWNTYSIVLSANNKFTSSGTYDLSVDANRAGSMFGMKSSEVLTNVRPVLSIESVELLP